MSLHRRLCKNIHFSILFFSCLFLENISLAKNKDLAGSDPQIQIDKYYFQTQGDIFYLKSEMAYFQGDAIQAIDYLKKSLLNDFRSFHLRFRLAELYREQGLFAEAAKHYKTLLKWHPHRQEIRSYLGDIYFIRDLKKQALKEYKQIEGKELVFLLRKARLFLEQKKWSLALETLNLAQKQALQEEDQGEILLFKAYIYGQLNNRTLKQKVLSQLLKLNLKEPLILKITEFYMGSGDTQGALNVLVSFQKRTPTSKEVARRLFTLYLMEKKNNKAYEQLVLLKSLGNLKDKEIYFMISFLLKQNRLFQAELYIQDLLTQNPSLNQYRYLLGVIHEKNSKWSLALETYQKISKESLYFIPAQLQMSQIWKDRGQTYRALQTLKEVALPSLALKEWKPTLIYGQYLWEAGQKRKAIQALSQGLKTFPHQMDLLFLRGFYLREQGKTQQALQDMKQVVEIDPSHGEALNFLAYTYAENKENLEQAEKWARRAQTLKPTSSYFLDTLGWVLFQKGAYTKAKKYLTQAFSRNNQDSQIAKHLGELYYMLKNFPKCEYFFKKALELETNDKKLTQIKRRLASIQGSL